MVSLAGRSVKFSDDELVDVFCSGIQILFCMEKKIVTFGGLPYIEVSSFLAK